MPNLPALGEWHLSNNFVSADPPFAVLRVNFARRTGTVRRSRLSTDLKQVRIDAADRFGAEYQIGADRGYLEATLNADNTLDIEFAGTVSTSCKARPVAGSLVGSLSASDIAPPMTPADADLERLLTGFAARSGNGAFPHIPRAAVVENLRLRLLHPGGIHQGQTYMCGPAAFMFSLASDRPLEYARYVTDLYETGRARIGTMQIEASFAFRMEPLAGGPRAADWIALGSLRDSSNWLLSYQRNSLLERVRGGTSDGEVSAWFRAAGYRDVWDMTSVRTRSMNARLASDLYMRGYKVCLSIDADMLGNRQAAAGFSLVSNHFVILTSPISFDDQGVKFTIFTWGSGSRNVPEAGPGEPDRMPLHHFTSKYFGFIAGRP